LTLNDGAVAAQYCYARRDKIDTLEEQVRKRDDKINTLEDKIDTLEEQVGLLLGAARHHRTRSLNAVTKTIVEAFLSIFSFRGKNRKAFTRGLRLPDWALECMSKDSLESEVELRCVETAQNTTHAANGSEALQTILEGHSAGTISEDEYRLLVSMLISVYKGATFHKPPIDGGLSSFLTTRRNWGIPLLDENSIFTSGHPPA
jgi:hypothetical protein